jgi:hypothetical protein
MELRKHFLQEIEISIEFFMNLNYLTMKHLYNKTRIL